MDGPEAVLDIRSKFSLNANHIMGGVCLGLPSSCQLITFCLKRFIVF